MENVMTTGMWWLTAAFILGITARFFKLPALIGFLAAGMLVEAFDIDHASMDELISTTLLLLSRITTGSTMASNTLSLPMGITSKIRKR